MWYAYIFTNYLEKGMRDDSLIVLFNDINKYIDETKNNVTRIEIERR